MAHFTTLEADPLPGQPSVIITDFTSIAGKTQNNKNCNIPFLYNNADSYFCALNQSRFVCAVDQANNFDYCNLGLILISFLIRNILFFKKTLNISYFKVNSPELKQMETDKHLI